MIMLYEYETIFWPMKRNAAPKNHSIHYVGSLRTNRGELLRKGEDCSKVVAKIVEKNNASCIDYTLHYFKNDDDNQDGFTATFMMAESHIAIHTWPEYGVCELDVYLCNYLRDNRERCKTIFEQICDWFSPIETNIQSITRTLGY